MARYPIFQAYFREYQPRLLAIWGEKALFFLPADAVAFKRDLPNAEVRFRDSGHFALETHSLAIAAEPEPILANRPMKKEPNPDDPSVSDVSRDLS